MTSSNKSFWIVFLSASIGNIFEHYDRALFSFLAPFLAPIFFRENSPLTALILTYSILILGLISKPLGALVFGYVGDNKGRRTALYITLIGMAITTFSIGCLPTFAQIGWTAPALLAFSRLAQNFFASGETIGGTLLILERCRKNKRALYNGIYECSTILGILFASIGAGWLSTERWIENQWRWLYWIGGITGGCALIIRFCTRESAILIPSNRAILSLLWKFRIPFLTIVITSGFSYANYYTITSLLNGYLPFVSSITQSEAIKTNSIILGLDCLLLPFSGLLAMHIPKEKLLKTFASLICLLAIPLYSILPQAETLSIIIIRMIFVIFGVGFSVILVPYYQELIPQNHCYTLICFGTAIGSQLVGNSAYFIGLLLLKQTGWSGAPSIYLTATGLLSLMILKYTQIKKANI